jgi:membrane-bound lytic murein transglycosylase D
MRFSFPRLIVALLALASPAVAERLELPSQGLESRIAFWKKVYTQYGENDVIIHDRVHVNLIYDVAAKGEQSDKIAAVQQLLGEVGSNLATPENLSAPAQQILDLIRASGLPLTAETIANLRDNIHTQLGIKERFRDGVIRSGRYVDGFREIFEREGMPADLALLPLVESSFENRALSNAGAAGIWQFTRGTGRLYLTVNRKVDERLDPMKATRAAARLLLGNYSALGAWPLAITAYNHGRAGMQRAQSELGSSEMTKIIDDYKGPLFGYASMNFYSEFVAAVEVYRNYPDYFGELVLDQPGTRQTPAAPAPIRVAARTPVRGSRVQPARAASPKYKVQKGDTLTDIAMRFGLSVRELMDTNNLRNSMIHAGQILLVR